VRQFSLPLPLFSHALTYTHTHKHTHTQHDRLSLLSFLLDLGPHQSTLLLPFIPELLHWAHTHNTHTHPPIPTLTHTPISTQLSLTALARCLQGGRDVDVCVYVSECGGWEVVLRWLGGYMQGVLRREEDLKERRELERERRKIEKELAAVKAIGADIQYKPHTDTHTHTREEQARVEKEEIQSTVMSSLEILLCLLLHAPNHLTHTHTPTHTQTEPTANPSPTHTHTHTHTQHLAAPR
jgi:hypothetical protein